MINLWRTVRHCSLLKKNEMSVAMKELQNRLQVMGQVGPFATVDQLCERLTTTKQNLSKLIFSKILLQSKLHSQVINKHTLFKRMMLQNYQNQQCQSDAIALLLHYEQIPKESIRDRLDRIPGFGAVSGRYQVEVLKIFLAQDSVPQHLLKELIDNPNNKLINSIEVLWMFIKIMQKNGCIEKYRLSLGQLVEHLFMHEFSPKTYVSISIIEKFAEICVMLNNHVNRFYAPRQKLSTITFQLFYSLNMKKEEANNLLAIICQFVEIGQSFASNFAFKQLYKYRDMIELGPQLQRFCRLIERYISRTDFLEYQPRKNIKSFIFLLNEEIIMMLVFLINKVFAQHVTNLFNTLLECPKVLSLCYINLNWKDFFINVRKENHIAILCLTQYLPSLDIEKVMPQFEEIELLLKDARRPKGYRLKILYLYSEQHVSLPQSLRERLFELLQVKTGLDNDQFQRVQKVLTHEDSEGFEYLLPILQNLSIKQYDEVYRQHAEKVLQRVGNMNIHLHRQNCRAMSKLKIKNFKLVIRLLETSSILYYNKDNIKNMNQQRVVSEHIINLIGYLAKLLRQQKESLAEIACLPLFQASRQSLFALQMHLSQHQQMIPMQNLQLLSLFCMAQTIPPIKKNVIIHHFQPVDFKLILQKSGNEPCLQGLLKLLLIDFTSMKNEDFQLLFKHLRERKNLSSKEIMLGILCQIGYFGRQGVKLDEIIETMPQSTNSFVPNEMSPFYASQRNSECILKVKTTQHQSLPLFSYQIQKYEEELRLNNRNEEMFDAFKKFIIDRNQQSLTNLLLFIASVIFKTNSQRYSQAFRKELEKFTIFKEMEDIFFIKSKTTSYIVSLAGKKSLKNGLISCLTRQTQIKHIAIDPAQPNIIAQFKNQIS